MLVGALAEGEIHVPRLGRDRRGARLPADRGHEPVRRRRHRAGQPGDRRPHVPDRDRLPGRGGRARDRRRATGPASARSSAAVALTRAHPRAPAGPDGLVGARRDRPRPARPRPGRACAASAAPGRDVRRRRDRRALRPPAAEEGCDRTPEAIVLELIERPSARSPPSRRREAGAAAGPPAGGRRGALSGAAAARRRRASAAGGRCAAHHLAAAHAQPGARLARGRPARRGGVPRPPARRRRRRRRAARRPRRGHRPAAARAGAPARRPAVRRAPAGSAGRAGAGTGGSSPAAPRERATSTST